MADGGAQDANAPDANVNDAGMIVLVAILFLVAAFGVCHGLWFRTHMTAEYLHRDEADVFVGDDEAASPKRRADSFEAAARLDIDDEVAVI